MVKEKKGETSVTGGSKSRGRATSYGLSGMECRTLWEDGRRANRQLSSGSVCEISDYRLRFCPDGFKGIVPSEKENSLKLVNSYQDKGGSRVGSGSGRAGEPLFASAGTPVKGRWCGSS